MTMYRVEVRDTDNWNDWGSSHFHVFAMNERQARKKACELTYPQDIVRIVAVKAVNI